MMCELGEDEHWTPSCNSCAHSKWDKCPNNMLRDTIKLIETETEKRDRDEL